MKPIPHVGPDTPTATSPSGAKQSDLPYRCDLLPAAAVLMISKTLKDGADRYGVDNWRGIPVSDHVNHALVHLFAYLAGDVQDDHLGHAACRLLFAKDLTS